MAPAPASASFSLLLILFLLNPNPSFASDPSRLDGELSILNWHDYSPPSPPSPPPPFDFPSCSCEGDLGGAGDFDTLCVLRTSLNLSNDVYIEGKGSLSILEGILLSCSVPGCFIAANLSSGSIRMGNGSKIVAGRVYLVAKNVSLAVDSAVNTTALAGDPPPQTSGTPSGTHGDGGGHGGRGASCFVNEGQTQEDSWGGDAYAWNDLERPDSYGSRGGSTSKEVDYGGGGGGRIWLKVEDMVDLDGVISSDGGNGGANGGGGSGGSIYIVGSKM